MAVGGRSVPVVGSSIGPALQRAVPVVAMVAVPVFTYALLRHALLVGLAVAATAFAFFALSRPQMAALLLIPLSLVFAALGGWFAVAGAVAVLTLAAALRPASGVPVIRLPHLCIGLLAGVLLVGFLFPVVEAPVLPATSARLADLAAFMGITSAQAHRLADIAGLLAGLALLAVSIAAPPHPQRLARTVALAGGAAAGYVLADGQYADGRLEGLGCNPNYLGIVLALPLVAAVGLTRQARNPMWLGLAALCLAAMIETESRGAFLSAAVGVIVVLVQGRARSHQTLIVLAVLGFAVVVPGSFDMLVQAGAGSRPVAELTYNSDIRRLTAQFAAQVAMAHPIRGVGYGMFSTYAARSPDLGIFIDTHNDYLRLAAEAGVAAPAVFAVLLWLGTRRRCSGDMAILRAVVATYAVALLFANPLANLVITAPFWVCLGRLLAREPDAAVAKGDGGVSPERSGLR